ncbi:MAG TPA: rod shape-determining protein MreC [Verrucomicrobiae bacterium]|nr:rod shape-determining protein MreC [Verrucomicrobiae bacterium]
MLRKPHYIALGLVGVLTLILLNLPAHTTARIKLAIASTFLPIFGIDRTARQLTHDAAEATKSRKELERELDDLRRTNQMLQIEAMRATVLERENDQLRQFVGRSKQPGWKLKFARVVGLDPANWWQSVVIDVGSRDGIRADLPVVTAQGLVGRISEVTPATSRVELIGNPTCKVAARVSQTGETGIIASSAGLFDTSLVTLSFFSSTSTSKPGQAVVTSGLGGIFPAGILIGQIAEEARPVEFGLRTEGQVKLAVNLSVLEYVWVIAQ